MASLSAAAEAVPLPMSDDANVWVAASDGDLVKVQQYIAQDPKLATQGDENGYSCIHAAAAYGHHEMITVLLGHGADLHARDTDGDTPLHHCDNPETAAFLMSLGAQPTVANNAGKTPAQVHLEDEEEAMVEYWRSVGILEAGPIVTMVSGGEDFEGQETLGNFDSEDIMAEGGGMGDGP